MYRVKYNNIYYDYFEVYKDLRLKNGSLSQLEGDVVFFVKDGKNKPIIPNTKNDFHSNLDDILIQLDLDYGIRIYNANNLAEFILVKSALNKKWYRYDNE